MTDTKITLSSEGKLQLIKTVLRQARNQFPTLTKDKIHIGIKHHYIYKPTWTEAFDIFLQGTPDIQPKNIDIELQENNPDQLTITSHNQSFDNATIWISKQLDRAYSKIEVQINTPELTKPEGEWKCPNCGNINRSTFLECAR